MTSGGDRGTQDLHKHGGAFGPADAAGGRSVFVDYDLYAHYLADADLSEEQKREFLEVLWNIICEFVSLGWGVHPIQQALEAKENCGKQPGTATESAVSSGDAVQWLDTNFIEQFTAASDREEDRDGEKVEDTA